MLKTTSAEERGPDTTTTTPEPDTGTRAEADDQAAAQQPYFVLEPRHSSTTVSLEEMWHYRDLLYFLTWREISLRYKQTLLGVLWAVIQPVMTMVVFTVFLGRLAKVPSDGIPYPVFTYLGLLPWLYFSNAVSRSAASLVNNSHVLSKVYFPRLLIPLSATLSALVDFAISFVVLVALMLWYGIVPAASTLYLIPLSVITALAALGVGMGLSALNVRYRDVTHALPFLIQVWMYATPVVYPTSLVPEKWRAIFALNPLTGIIDAYRSAALGRPLDWRTLGVSSAVVLVLLFLGARSFNRMEREFADIV